ncbi:MAG: M23 family metallopeptidase [Candidatus Omnitrophica bacterium]|nr:M23 family metallopeptidase [Candidatus Omnitrophota bacterium]
MRPIVPTRASWWMGLVAGCGALTAAIELPYVNWYPVVAPIDARPLVIRQDAGGDGRFLAPRSGHRRHRGIDVVAELESPVRAIRSGTVVTVGRHRGLGRYVEIEHRRRLRSLYAHLQTVTVSEGQRVAQGAVIGAVGKTGNARFARIAPHLHLEVVRDGQPIDPARLGLRLIEPAAPAGWPGSPLTDDDAGE